MFVFQSKILLSKSRKLTKSLSNWTSKRSNIQYFSSEKNQANHQPENANKVQSGNPVDLMPNISSLMQRIQELEKQVSDLKNEQTKSVQQLKTIEDHNKRVSNFLQRASERIFNSLHLHSVPWMIWLGVTSLAVGDRIAFYLSYFTDNKFVIFAGYLSMSVLFLVGISSNPFFLLLALSIIPLGLGYMYFTQNEMHQPTRLLTEQEKRELIEFERNYKSQQQNRK